MSRQVQMHEKEPHGAPRWYVGFSTLTTILMTFFIVLTVNMTKTRNLGYAGAGVGAFQKGFNSHGLPGVLRGARRIVDFVTWGGRFVPEDAAQGAGEIYTGRLIDMPERDLKQVLSRMASSREDVVLPLALGPEQKMDARARAELAAAGRMIRRTEGNVLVCAALPRGQEPEDQALCRATEWALAISRRLADVEKIPADRLTAVGRLALDSGNQGDGPSGSSSGAPSVMLVLRPRAAADVAPPAGADPLRAKPVTRYEIVR